MKLKRLIQTLILLLIFSVGHSQTQFKAIPTAENSILIEGTSNIHDWEMLATDYTSQIDLSLKDGEVEKINSVKLSIPVKSLDSGKRKMDKNAYEAMKADDYKLVNFNSSSAAEVSKISSGVYKGSVKGKLTISGTTKMVEIPVVLSKSSAGYTLKAEQGLDMTDYNIEPPTALFGTITTGETVNIIFNLTHYKS